MREHHRTHTYDTHSLGVRDRICISRYPDSHLSRNNSSGWGGRLSLLSRNAEFCCMATHLSFVLIPEVYPRQSFGRGTEADDDGTHPFSRKSHQKKRGMSGKRKTEDGKGLVLRYVGRTDGACFCGLVLCSQVTLGHVCYRQPGASNKVITNKKPLVCWDSPYTMFLARNQVSAQVSFR